MKCFRMPLVAMLAALPIFSPVVAHAQTVTWSNLAGLPGGAGTTDGTGIAARFSSPAGVAADSSNNVYVADSANCTIRKITSVGKVTTVAGLAGTPGTANGNKSAARFDGPTGIAVDSGGYLYVADQNNHVIRKITPSGDVSTFAGQIGTSGSADSTDGTGATAKFNSPGGVAVDGSGNVYVADSGNNTIRKITPAGNVTTWAGTAGTTGSTNATGADARFNYPLGLAVNASGDVFVADLQNHIIRKITSARVVTTFAGTAGSNGSTDGATTGALFDSPSGVALDGSGNLYVADNQNSTIRKISGGTVSTFAGTAGTYGSADATGALASFYLPFGVAANASGIYVGDYLNNTVRMITTGGVVSTLAGSASHTGTADGSGTTARFYYPFGVTADGSGNIYVADSANNTIRAITAAGDVSTLAGSGTPDTTDGNGIAASFDSPSAVASTTDGTIYVAETFGNVIRVITPAGDVSTLAGEVGVQGNSDGTGTHAHFQNPSGVAVDATGTIYVADQGNHTIRVVTSDGTVTTLAGTAGIAGSANGTGVNATFNNPSGVAVDGSGTVYVADSGNHIIRKIMTGGVVTTLAGSAGVPGSDDGTSSAARFRSPNALAVDAGGNVYVADTGNGTIRKITPSGVVTTLGGSAGKSGGSDGIGANARFNSPTGIVVSGGSIYVTDGVENRVIAGTAPAAIVVEQPAGTPLVDNTGTVSFGAVAVGVPQPLVLTIRNNGLSSLIGLSITKDGANSSEYAITQNPSAPLPTGGVTTCVITFTPAAAGIRTAAIHIASNDPTQNPFDINFSGTGVFSPDISVEQPAGTALTDGTSTVPFDVVPVNTTKVLTFTVRSTGSSSLTGLAITKDGTNNAEFTVSALGATTLAPSASTTFTVSFKPTATGARTAAIHIASNLSGSKNPFDINLIGGLSGEAHLTALVLSQGTLSPSFASGTNAYTATVTNSITSLTVTPTVMQSGATVRVNGTLVPSGLPSAGIPLSAGSNVITTVVTAPDGVSTQTYTVTVSRSGSPYQSWAAANGLTAGNSGYNDNPDKDNRTNLLEYAFGTNPLTGDTGPLTLSGSIITRHGDPFMITSPTRSAVFARRHDYLTSGLTYFVQFSTDLITWTNSSANPTILADDGVIQAVSVPFPDGPATQFFRVVVNIGNVTTSSPFQTWASAQGLTTGNSGYLDNPDNDGRPNLLEYAFGTNPLTGDPGAMILSGTTIMRRGDPYVKTSPVLTAVFAQRDDYLSSGLTYHVQFSTDLKTWTTSTATPTVLADDGVIQAVSVPFPSGARQFFRVVVGLP